MSFDPVRMIGSLVVSVFVSHDSFLITPAIGAEGHTTVLGSRPTLT